jgi:hypothetical protein
MRLSRSDLLELHHNATKKEKMKTAQKQRQETAQFTKRDQQNLQNLFLHWFRSAKVLK